MALFLVLISIFLCLLVFDGLFCLSFGRQPDTVNTAALFSGSGLKGKNSLQWYPLAPIIGKPVRHTVTAKETLLDIARHYDLGFNELAAMYPHLDPWVPAPGITLKIPSQRILPGFLGHGILINIPEMRLYYFTAAGGKSRVLTFPAGIGDIDFPTPIGTYRISSKEINPTWYIPPSLQKKYGVKSLPPGQDNPLGSHWMRLGTSMYGIHGTNFPWSVGRQATHGCIRLYPEDIHRLFPLISPGTLVRIIYEPVKLAVVDDRVFVEVHPDVYKVKGNLLRHSETLLTAKHIRHLIDKRRLRQAIAGQNGMPVEITRSARPKSRSLPAPFNPAEDQSNAGPGLIQPTTEMP